MLLGTSPGITSIDLPAWVFWKLFLVQIVQQMCTLTGHRVGLLWWCRRPLQPPHVAAEQGEDVARRDELDSPRLLFVVGIIGGTSTAGRGV